MLGMCAEDGWAGHLELETNSKKVHTKSTLDKDGGLRRRGEVNAI